MTDPQTSSAQHPGRYGKLATDAMRALAHPLRLRILDELSINGPLTASGLGERLAESSGATSYHLRQLEKHGLVREVTAKGNARERWWERPPGSMSTPEPEEFPPGSAERLATQLIENEWNRSREAHFHEFLNEGRNVFSQEWIDATSVDTTNLRLTPEQLHQLVVDLDVVLWKHIDAYKTTPTAGSRPVQIHLNAFPLVRGDETTNVPGKTSGNVGGPEKNS